MRKCQQNSQQKMQVLSPIEGKREFEFGNLILCALSTKRPQNQLRKPPQNSVLGIQPLQKVFSQLKFFHNFKMTKTTIPANKLFT